MSLCYQAALTDWRHSSVFQGHLQPGNKGKHLLAPTINFCLYPATQYYMMHSATQYYMMHSATQYYMMHSATQFYKMALTPSGPHIARSVKFDNFGLPSHD